MTDFVRIDLHVHSRHSPDSRLTLDEIAGRLPYVGLRGFAITDHNSVAAHRELPALRERFPGVLVVPGIEVTTREGHLLVYGVAEAPRPRRSVAETLDWVRQRGGIGVLAHPFRFPHGAGRAIARTSAVTAIETLNGHSSVIANAKAELIAAERHLGATGGSDGHEIADVGRAFTEFAPDIDSVEALLDELRRGQTSGAGASLRWPGRLRWAVRAGALRVARGFRAV